MLSRRELQAKCREYKRRGLSGIDCRSTTQTLLEEISRIETPQLPREILAEIAKIDPESYRSMLQVPGFTRSGQYEAVREDIMASQSKRIYFWSGCDEYFESQEASFYFFEEEAIEDFGSFDYWSGPYRSLRDPEIFYGFYSEGRLQDCYPVENVLDDIREEDIQDVEELLDEEYIPIEFELLSPIIHPSELTIIEDCYEYYKAYKAQGVYYLPSETPEDYPELWSPSEAEIRDFDGPTMC